LQSVVFWQHAKQLPLPALQHCPVGHCESVVQGQSMEHFSVAVLQHWSATQSALVLQHGTQALPWQHLPGPHWASVQHALAERHDPLQHCCPVPHCASVVQAHAPHCSVVGLQHSVAVQSAPDRHPGAQVLLLQMGSAVGQSPFPQQFPRTHAEPQHLDPAPHCASVAQGQLAVVHWLVVGSQHWSATQSAAERHPATHRFLVQMGVLPAQSALLQQSPVAQVPPQHFCPLPHWASVVHWQFCVPHCWVTVLQHWSARQSVFEWQQEAQEPLVQQSVDGQSESAQHAASVHEPPQHFWPPGHWASVVQAQFCEPHVWVATSQHWVATQSAFEQQFPGTHSRTAADPSGAPTLPSGPPEAPSGAVPGWPSAPTVPSVGPPSVPPWAALLPLEHAVIQHARRTDARAAQRLAGPIRTARSSWNP
jgi:hypothetical protein